QSQQQMVFHAGRDLIRRQKAVHADTDRRQADRIDYIHPVKLQTEDNREFRVLTRDLSPTGMRLLGSRSLLGQKVRVHLTPSSGKGCTFLVRILWSCAVGDELFENGGSFLGMGGGGPRINLQENWQPPQKMGGAPGRALPPFQEIPLSQLVQNHLLPPNLRLSDFFIQVKARPLLLASVVRVTD